MFRPRPSTGHPSARRLLGRRRVWLLATARVLATAVAPAVWVHVYSRAWLHEGRPPDAPVALVLGARIYPDGVGDDSGAYDRGRTVRGMLREDVADIEAVGQIALRPRPHFLGRQETAVADALRR